MKYILFPVIAIAITLFIINKSYNNNPSTNKTPQPTRSVIMDKDDGNEQYLREKWINQLHKAAPGVNWRTINYNIKCDKAAKYFKSKGITSDISIAGGLLTGSWRETGSNNLAGRTHFVEYDFDEDSIYCGTSGGNIWKAGKQGQNWRVLNDNYKIDDIKMIKKINHASGKRLLVASGAWGIPGFLYSDNDGQTWSASAGLSSIVLWGFVVRSVVVNDTENTIYLLAMEWDYDEWEKATCIYVSQNHGESFTKIHTFLESSFGDEGKFDIWCSADGSETVYFLENNNISRINSDFSISSLTSISYTTTGSVILKGVEIESNTTLYVAVCDSDVTDFYVSQNAGSSWSASGTVNISPFFKNSFEVSAKNPDVVYYGGMEAYYSYDGAQTWTKVNEWYDYYDNMVSLLHADIPGFNSFLDSNGDEFVYINTDGGTFISYDSLQSVQNISLEKINASQYYSVYSHRSNSSVIYAGSQDQGYQLCNSNDGVGPEDFTQIISGDYGHIVSSDGGNSIWMVYPDFAMYYPNAVTDPYFSDWWEFECSGQFWIPPLMADPLASNKVFLGGGSTTTGTHIFHLTSFSGWIDIEEQTFDFSGSSGSTAISAIAHSDLNNDYRYVMNGDGEFFTSTDGGVNWTMTSGFDGPDGNYLYGAAVVPSKIQVGKIYVAGSGYSNPGAFVSVDNGSTFIPITNGLPGTMTYELAITDNDEFIFAATDVGPYVYVSAENQWYDLGGGIAPDQTYWTVDYNSTTKIVHFGTYGRGIWDFKIESGLVDVSNSEKTMVSFIYPNPATNFVNVNADNNSLLKIFSINGKLIKQVQIKNNSATIDISDLKPGVYIFSCANKKEKIFVY